MKTIRFGQTTLHVTRLAVGCWQLSPGFWGEIDIDDWTAAMDAAAEIGINFVDTADAYGQGRAEEMLGKYLRDRGNRAHWVIATKFFWDWTSPRAKGLPLVCPNTTRDYILRACEASLRRLQVDHIELYQLHAWDPLLHPEEVAAAISQLQAEGKVRHFGVSNLNVEAMAMLKHWVPVESLQPKYSLLHRVHEEREFPYTLGEGIGTLIYSPLGRGLLSGKVTAASRFDDARKDDPQFSEESLGRLAPALETLDGLAAELGLTVPQFAIRWALTHPAVDVAIIGTKKPSHLETLLPALDAVLPAPYWHAAAALFSSPVRY